MPAAYYLDSFVGDGSYLNPFRSRGGGQVIDLRPDGTALAGLALSVLPGRSDGPGRTFLGFDGDLDTAAVSVKTALAGALGVTLTATTLRDMIVELAVQGTKWATVKPTAGGLLEVHLGGLLYSRPVIAGGSSFFETWTHADSAGALTADLTWTLVEGTAWGIVSNQAKAAGNVGDNNGRADSDASTNDTVTIVTLVSNAWVAANASGLLIARKDSSATLTNYLLNTYRDGGVNNLKGDLYKRIAGTYTLISALAVLGARSDGDQFRLTCNGSSIKIENVTKGFSDTTTDSSITTGKRGGVRCALDNAGNNIVLDTFSHADVRPDPPYQPYYQRAPVLAQ